MPTTKPRSTVLLSLTLLVTSSVMAAPTPRHPTVATLSPNARQLFADSMRTAEASFDPAAHLIRKPQASAGNDAGNYMLRESTWFALALLLRDKKDDRQTAAAILDTALSNQFTDPQAQWLGSFKRSPEEPIPTAAHHVHYLDYDPNWRVFIGTTFQIILIEFPDRIPAPLAARMYHAIDLALLGESKEHRLTPSYSNIALMYGALWDFAAAHNHDPAQQAQSTQWNNDVYKLFKLHNSFSEYNSPTYYGVDLYGLALLRDYASTPHLRAIAATMESTLWSDIAAFYSPTLRNISGPWDRSYGMDMQLYVTVVGVWLRTVLPAPAAPLPTQLNLDTDHLGDLWFAPHFVILGTRVPPAAMAMFHHPAAPHLVTRAIDDKRTATAFIGANIIFGGESNPNPDASAANNQVSQAKLATIHWQLPSGQIGWVRLLNPSPIDASADPTGLTIKTTPNAPPSELKFLVHAPGTSPEKLTRTNWPLPGLTITATTDAASFKAEPAGSPQDSNYILTYTATTRIRLTIPSK